MIQGLSERLKELRRQHGYSQKTVSDLIHVVPSAIAAYETGERTPSVEKLIALAKLYRVSVDYLLGLEKSEPGKFIDVSHLTECYSAFYLVLNHATFKRIKKRHSINYSDGFYIGLLYAVPLVLS